MGRGGGGGWWDHPPVLATLGKMALGTSVGFHRKLVFPVQNANVRFTLTSSYSNMTISRQLAATNR